jgi:hypothetical protein
MNPVTRRLLDEIDDPELAAVALAWDRFEEQIVFLYRTGACTAEEAEEYGRGRRSVQQSIGRWTKDLEPCWKATRVDGAPLRQSPFLVILGVEEARGVLGNWDLMRLLPAAREALNYLLLERGSDRKSMNPAPGRS